MTSDGENSEPTAVSPTPSRLLVITYEYPPIGGGLGKAVRQTAIELASLGHEVTILTARFGDLAPEEQDGPLRLVRLPAFRRHANHARLTDVLSFSVSGLLFGKRRLASDNSFHGILAYLTIPSGIVGLYLSLRMKAPLLTLLRGTDVPGHTEIGSWMHALASPVTQLVWRHSHRIVSNSRSMADQLEAARPGLRVDAVWNGVDTSKYSPPEVDQRREQPIRVLYAGRLVPVKRLEVLLEAWARICRDDPSGAILQLAGFGPERERLETKVRSLGVNEHVQFLGFLSESEMIRAYQAASVFVSISRDEGMPNSVLEAMACGLPVVLSDIGPHREIMGESRAGEFCAGDDPVELAGMLRKMMESPEQRALMGSEARLAMMERFSWRKTAEGLKALLSGPPRH